MKTERAQLASDRRHTKLIDMEWVYQELDRGRTIKNVAEELNISVSTLRRRHSEYQEAVREENRLEQESKKDEQGEIGAWKPGDPTFEDF